MIFAGWQLNQRKPRPAPTSAEETTASSPEGDGDRAADGEAIQPVREVDCVGGAHDDKSEENEGQPAHVRDDGSLEERQIKRARLNFDERIG